MVACVHACIAGQSIGVAALLSDARTHAQSQDMHDVDMHVADMLSEMNVNNSFNTKNVLQ